MINGLVLMGGRSRRMGSDKALMDVRGVPQREFLFHELRHVCDDAFTSCRADQHVPGWMNPIYDSAQVPGPLNGILSAFGRYTESAWLTVAVDMPCVDRAVLSFLISHRDPKRLATSFYNELTGDLEPMLTLWEPGALNLLVDQCSDGNYSALSFLNSHPVKGVCPPSVETFTNLNTPDDVRRFAYQLLE
jgi:molybdopterin-guanine dinucleotide biosynthesis protein A